MKYHKHLLQACAQALNDIFFEGYYADKCIEYHFRNNRKWGGRDRRFFAETVYDCVRWWRLDWHLIKQKPGQVDVSFLGPSLWRRGLPRPDFPEFSEKQWSQFAERYAQISDVALKESFPDELAKILSAQLGPSWEKLAPALNRPNAVVLRVNQQKTNLYELQSRLADEGVKTKTLMGAAKALILEERKNVFQTQCFKKGLFEVQDGSSQQVADFLELLPGQRVVDACAGAGGKSLAIADLLNNKGKVVALDIHQWKLDQLKLRARRNSYSNIEMKVIENSKVIKRLHGKADRLLLDVPCSGLGVLRRNPDTKWKLNRERIKELEEIQGQILHDYAKILKPGGLMVYATCSILPSENQGQVEKFLASHPEFQLKRQRTIYPVLDGFDGFYMAAMELLS